MDFKQPEENNNAVKRPVSPANEPANSFIPAEEKSYSEWEFEAAAANVEKAAERKARKEQQEMRNAAREKREKAERYVLLKMGRLMQDNIIAAGRITERVMKAARDGRPPEEIALAAVKGLSLLVNDPMVYTAIEKKYRQQYGITLEAKPPYNIIHLEPEQIKLNIEK